MTDLKYIQNVLYNLSFILTLRSLRFHTSKMFSHFISYTATHEFFQVELVVLLVSLIVSLFFSSSFPYFVASAICLFTTIGTLIFELFRQLSGHYTYVEATTTLTFAITLSGTFMFVLARRLSNLELRWHTITALGLWAYLAVRAVWILEDTARPIHLDVSSCHVRHVKVMSSHSVQIDQRSFEAAGFAALHLTATVLLLNERVLACQTALETEHYEKALNIV